MQGQHNPPPPHHVGDLDPSPRIQSDPANHSENPANDVTNHTKEPSNGEEDVPIARTSLATHDDTQQTNKKYVGWISSFRLHGHPLLVQEKAKVRLLRINAHRGATFVNPTFGNGYANSVGIIGFV